MAGISGFVRHAKENSFGGQWLNDWKEDKKVVIWLHTQVPPAPCFGHSFMLIDVVEDKDNPGGTPKRIMRYPRFVSPDPEPVHRNQHFRKDDDSLRVPPDRDPFLLLREWLRRADHIGLEDAIFQWRNPKDNSVVTWNRGELSGLVKRAKSNFGHTLDTKQEYIFVVALNADPEKGCFLARESQLLGRKMSEVIGQQQQMLGEETGDPLLNPYPFVWEYNKKAASPMDTYKVYKAENVPYTDAVYQAITSEEFPDPTEFCKPKDGDPEKIRAAMEAAAQVDLPFDEIFSDDSAVRLSLTGPRAPMHRPAAGQRAPSSANGQQRQAAAPKGTRAPAGPAAPAGPPASQVAARGPAAAPKSAGGVQRPATPAAVAGQPRRRKVEQPKPEPEVERIPCEDCQQLMLPTESVCAGCGAQYEIGDEVAAAEPTAASAPAGSKEACFSCQGAVKNGVCQVCSLEQGDEIPF